MQIVITCGINCVKSDLSSGSNVTVKNSFRVWRLEFVGVGWGFLHCLLGFFALLRMPSCKNSFQAVQFFKFSWGLEVSLGSLFCICH